MSAGSWNGRPLPEQSDTTESRCCGIIERGMKRLGLHKAAPAKMNKYLIHVEPRAPEKKETACGYVTTSRKGAA